MADIDLDAPALTKRQALEIAERRLNSVVTLWLDADLEPDEYDKEGIREAHFMVRLALGAYMPEAARMSAEAMDGGEG